jgi:hypothetical protein
MLKVSASTALLLLANTPLVIAQPTATSPSPPAASSSTTAGSGTTSAPGKMSDQEVKSKLESQGYTQVTDVSSTPEGISAKAMKGGKAVALVIDSRGNVKESQVGP